MRKCALLLLSSCCLILSVCAQSTFKEDSISFITLSEVVVRSGINVPHFIQRIKNDTGFYKSFRNLRIMGYSSINDIRMIDNKERTIAGLHSKTRQTRRDGCRTMEIITQQSTGDFYKEDHSFNYYTAELFAALFYTRGKICGESNIIGDHQFSLQNKSGMAKHKEQLKMLFFNPGSRISGLPFMSNKSAIFDADMVGRYEMKLDQEFYQGKTCYVLHQIARPDVGGSVVIDEMNTWLDMDDLAILGRNYRMSYQAGLYKFKVFMEVEMVRFNGMVVPALVRYDGDWKIAFKKREHGIFTVTFSDYQFDP